MLLLALLEHFQRLPVIAWVWCKEGGSIRCEFSMYDVFLAFSER